jgi:hypothetical protein
VRTCRAVANWWRSGLLGEAEIAELLTPLNLDELAYVLTVDGGVYRRVLREMGDAHRVPMGMYYCCRDGEDGDHVGIGVAVAVLLVVLFFLVLGMVAWPNW